jgi:GNAT superfamily N-acetyltransferase
MTTQYKQIKINNVTQSLSLSLLHGKKDLYDTMRLHQIVVDSLTGSKKEWLLLKSIQYFSQMQNNEHGLTIGIRLNGKLIAKSIAVFPKYGSSNGLEGIRIPVRNDKIAVFESDTVMPEFQGIGIGLWMAEYRKQLVQSLGKTNILNQICYDNLANLAVSLKNGMQIIDAVYYYEDNAPIFYLNEDLLYNHRVFTDAEIIMPITEPFEKFINIINQDFIGVAIKEKQIQFRQQGKSL